MNVKELIERLSKFDPEFTVYVDFYIKNDPTFSVREAFRPDIEDVRIDSFSKTCRIGVFKQ